MPATYKSQTKSSSEKHPLSKGTSSPGQCAFNYHPKTRGGEGENVCLMYLVLCASSPHHPFTEFIQTTLYLPFQAGTSKDLSCDTVNTLWVGTNFETKVILMGWTGGLDVNTKHFDTRGKCQVKPFCEASWFRVKSWLRVNSWITS